MTDTWECGISLASLTEAMGALTCEPGPPQMALRGPPRGTEVRTLESALATEQDWLNSEFTLAMVFRQVSDDLGSCPHLRAPLLLTQPWGQRQCQVLRSGRSSGFQV